MTTHGMHGTTTYKSWVRMKQRCLDKNTPDYQIYGAAGIRVCERWMKFENFYRDMGKRPEGKTLERIDNAKGYAPFNCKWATRREQSINRSITVWIEYNGKRMCMTDWARELGFTKARLSQRLKAGWSIEKALTTPLQA